MPVLVEARGENPEDAREIERAVPHNLLALVLEREGRPVRVPMGYRLQSNHSSSLGGQEPFDVIALTDALATLPMEIEEWPPFERQLRILRQGIVVELFGLVVGRRSYLFKPGNAMVQTIASWDCLTPTNCLPATEAPPSEQALVRQVVMDLYNKSSVGRRGRELFVDSSRPKPDNLGLPLQLVAGKTST